MTRQLTLEVAGATPGEIERGLATARTVFANAGATASEAAAASMRRETLDVCGVYALMDGIVTLKERAAHPSIIAAAEAGLRWMSLQPGMQALTKREDDLAALWDEAEGAAVEACCQGWRSVPHGASLYSTGSGADEALDDGGESTIAGSASGWTAEHEAELVDWVKRQFVAGGFAALSRDESIEGLTVVDLDWYVAAPQLEGASPDPSTVAR